MAVGREHEGLNFKNGHRYEWTCSVKKTGEGLI